MIATKFHANVGNVSHKHYTSNAETRFHHTFNYIKTKSALQPEVRSDFVFCVDIGALKSVIGKKC